MLTQQQMVDVMLDRRYISALTFKVSDPRYLGEVKDALEQTGLSGPKMVNNIRLCIVIEDAQFNETLSSIAQRSKYLEILYPVLLALVCILGLITGFLSVNSRREDIALMCVHQRGGFLHDIYDRFYPVPCGLPLPPVCSEGAANCWVGVYAFFICYALSAGLYITANAKVRFHPIEKE